VSPKNTMEVNGYLFYVQQKKETHTGLEEVKGE